MMRRGELVGDLYPMTNVRRDAVVGDTVEVYGYRLADGATVAKVAEAKGG